MAYQITNNIGEYQGNIPNRATDTPQEFADNVYNYQVWIDGASKDINDVIPQMNALSSDVNDQAIVATNSANNAAQSETNAAATSNFRGIWDANTNYTHPAAVLYNGVYYVSLQDSTNQDPETATAYWAVVKDQNNTIHKNGSGLPNELSVANAGNTFKVADAVNPDEAVSKDQMDSKPVTFKNRIINGDFSIWQRGENALYGTPPAWAASTAYNVGDKIIPTTANGYYYECIVAGTSGTAEPAWTTTVGGTITDNTVTWEVKGKQLVNGYATADRIISANSNAGGQFIVTKSNLSNKNYIKFTTGIPNSDLTLGNYWYGLKYTFEGQHLYDLAINGKTITISFWFNSNITGEFPVALRNVGTGTSIDSYVTTFNYTTANTPKKVEITIPLNHTWAEPIVNDENIGFMLTICFINQEDFVAPAGTENTWQTGNYITTSTAVNWGATAGNFFEIAELQLEEGNVATAFECVPYDVQFHRCQRYYNRSGYSVGEAASYGSTRLGTAVGLNSNWVRGKVFDTKMRVTPTLSFSAVDGTIGAITDSSVPSTIQGPFSAYCYTSGEVGFLQNGAVSAGVVYQFAWTADAEL